MIVLWIVLALAVLVLIFCWVMSGYTLGIRRQTLEQARQWQEEHYSLDWYDVLQKEDYTVSAEDGYVLHVQHIVSPEAKGRYVIISHGYTDNRFGALKYAKIYLDRGFDVIVYDLRGHGANETAYCTYSARESRDLLALIRDTRSRYSDVQVLGLHGESLGAASTIACLRNHPQVDFAVSDCAFSNISDVLKGAMKGMHVPSGLLPVISLGAKLRCGYSFRDMRPLDGLENNHVPILFMHGADDTFILPVHSEILSRATSGAGEVCLIPGAGHAASVLTAPEDYRAKVWAFLDGLGLE